MARVSTFKLLLLLRELLLRSQITQKHKYFEFQNENLIRDSFVDEKVVRLLKAMLKFFGTRILHDFLVFDHRCDAR